MRRGMEQRPTGWRRGIVEKKRSDYNTAAWISRVETRRVFCTRCDDDRRLCYARAPPAPHIIVHLRRSSRRAEESRRVPLDDRSSHSAGVRPARCINVAEFARLTVPYRFYRGVGGDRVLSA